MSRLPSRRHVAGLVLGLVLLVPWAAMAQPSGVPAHARVSLAAPAGLLIHAWSALSQLWDGGTTGRRIALPSPAPGGEPSDPVATPRLKGGCSLDPDGHCVH